MAFDILIVCSGNTCRSPLAEVILERRVRAEGLDDVEVSSAGTFALDGSCASSGSLEIARENGLDLESFTSRRLTERILIESDLVLVMEAGHRSGVLGLSPVADTKTMLLGELSGLAGPEAAVADPFGGTQDSYRRTFTRIEELIERGFPKILKLASKKTEQS